MVVLVLGGIAIYVCGMFFATYIVGRFMHDESGDSQIAFVIFWPLSLPLFGLLEVSQTFYDKGLAAAEKKAREKK